MRWTLFIVVAWLAGCAGVQSPTVRVGEVEVQDITPQGTAVVVNLVMDNPNDIELPLPRATYRVEVDGTDAFSFVTVPDATLPPNGSISLALPAAFAAEQPLLGQRYRVNGSVSYRPPGEIRDLLTDYRFPLPSSGFSATGRLR